MEKLKAQRKKRRVFLIIGLILYVIFLTIPILLLIPEIRSFLNLEEPSIIATESGIYLADPLFAYWFRHEMM